MESVTFTFMCLSLFFLYFTLLSVLCSRGSDDNVFFSSCHVMYAGHNGQTVAGLYGWLRRHCLHPDWKTVVGEADDQLWRTSNFVQYWHGNRVQLHYKTTGNNTMKLRFHRHAAAFFLVCSKSILEAVCTLQRCAVMSTNHTTAMQATSSAAAKQ